MNKFRLFGLIALSSLTLGCASTAERHADSCGADCQKPCCTEQVACNHANSTFECSGCQPGKPCCADCAQKMAQMCPDCADKQAAGCPDCKDGNQCSTCAA